jgi:hypothetical protein
LILNNSRIISSALYLFSILLSACGGWGGSAAPAGGGTVSYSVVGKVSGLTSSVVLKDSSGENHTVSANGNTTFATSVPNGSTYDISVYIQPTGQTCSVRHGRGIVTSDITDVEVPCEDISYTVAGSISGLTGSVVLQDNGGDDLTVSANGTFIFATSITNGKTFKVTVLTQPNGQTCSVSAGAGTISGNNVSNVAVICATNTYSVGGTVSGLTGIVVLQNNNGDDLTVTADGAFTFATQVANSSPYSVTVLIQPAGQNCSVASGTGTISLANVTNLAITCTANTYTIGGTVTGLNGIMVLQNNGTDKLAISANGIFTFATAVTYGNPFNVSQFSLQYTNQICTITGGSGAAISNITNIKVSCKIPPTGTWSATGALTTGRSDHTETLLQNGKVLVTGGAENSVGSLASSELYDPVSGTWSVTGAMTTTRRFHTATLLENGKVLVTGGYGLNNLASSELYDPATGTWSTTGSLNFARNTHTATLLPSGKVLVTGGFDGASTFLAISELYDPATGTWSTTGALATARDKHRATLLPNGKVLVTGGWNGTLGIYVTGNELYDPATGTWNAAGSLTTARIYHTATSLPNGKVLVTGGANGANLASSELYDPATGTWSATTALNTGRSYHTATLLPSGKVLVTGGWSGTVNLVSSELYDPATGIWSATGALINARVNHTATLLSSGKVLVTAGFVNGGQSMASCELYW